MSNLRRLRKLLSWRSWRSGQVAAAARGLPSPNKTAKSSSPPSRLELRALTTAGVPPRGMDVAAVKSRLRALDLRPRFHYPDDQYPGLRRSAVLMPLVLRQGELHVLFAQRAHGLRVQGGHVGFPGGVRDTDDEHELETALREAEEEIGLPPDQVEVLAMLPPHFIEPNFSVVPFLGLVPPHFRPSPNPHEVALVFEIPLRDFLSSDVAMHEFDHGGFQCTYPMLHHYLGGDAQGKSRGEGGKGGMGMERRSGRDGEVVWGWKEGKGVQGGPKKSQGGEMVVYGATAWDCVMAAEAVYGCWGKHGGRLPGDVTSYWDHVVQHHLCFHALCHLVSRRLSKAKL